MYLHVCNAPTTPPFLRKNYNKLSSMETKNWKKKKNSSATILLRFNHCRII